jgi:hypothetical protein
METQSPEQEETETRATANKQHQLCVQTFGFLFEEEIFSFTEGEANNLTGCPVGREKEVAEFCE